MRVLVACEYSAIVRDAFRALGHDAWSCDLRDTEGDPRWHIRGDAIEAAYCRPWDLLIAHPECTFMANSGAKHLYLGMKKENGADPDRWARLGEAQHFFKTLWRAPIRRKAFENPIMVGHVRRLFDDFPAPTQTVQPWMFGRNETKAIILYLDGLAPLAPPYLTYGQFRAANDLPADSKPEARVHRMAPGESRGKERSRFYPEIAEAMAKTWGGDEHQPERRAA